ncbi:putative glycosyl transferase [Calothrix sp. NIES-4071]|nr:putative glycosyl transferase [Calothrix sp. NIES-4071]BAZ62663.1 putative glycosyl transferase [Calothrix sp. NIES-4105]
MKYHIVLSRAFDLESIAQNSQAGKSPCHVMWEASQILRAKIHQPHEQIFIPSDKIRALVIGNKQHWALARALSQQLTEDSVVFCTGEDIGIPVASLCGANSNRPKIAVFIHNINRLRGRLALKLFQVQDKIDLFITYTQKSANFLREYLNLPESKVKLFVEQPTDISFFKPGKVSSTKTRPIIASAGLEQRDYRTLAAATQDLLDIEVKICVASPNAKEQSRAFPEVVPNNMSCRYYDWQELVQLYRDADIVVIPLFQNNYQAGLSTMFEALACRRPVIITKSPGIITELEQAGAIQTVTQGDALELRQAITELLNNPQKADMLALKGYELILQHYNHKLYIEKFVKIMSNL